MPERCVAARCSNVSDPEKHISMHKIPFFGENCPIKQKRRKRWIDFVLERRKMWVPGKTSSLCSKNFTADDFERPLNMELNLKRELKKDSIGFCVYPTKHAKRKGEDDEPPSKRSRDNRMIARSAKSRIKTLEEPEATAHVTSGPSTSYQAAQIVQSDFVFSSQSSQDMQKEGSTGSHVKTLPSQAPEDTVSNINQEEDQENSSEFAQDDQGKETSAQEQEDVGLCTVHLKNQGCTNSAYTDEATQTLADQRCNLLIRENEKLMTQLTPVREALARCQGKNKNLKRNVNSLTHKVKELEGEMLVADSSSTVILNDSVDKEDAVIDQGCDDEDEDDETIEEEPDFSLDGEHDLSSEGEETDTSSIEDESTKTKAKSIPLSSNYNLRAEPKHIVFLSKLLLLFQLCHFCRTENKPKVTATENGTEVVIKAECTNPSCRKEFTWHSQPIMPGTKTAAGNFLLCMATLFSGGSFSRVAQIFQHMGLSCISLNTFFTHQRTKLFPTVHLFWKKYQANLLSQLKELGGITIAGDGRHDSMGHCAKYCAYTIFCCTLPRIIHFALVQRNQAGNSPAMEFLGFQSCMDFLLGCGFVISTFISDRHTQIASHMKNVLKNITHYFDLWHLKKKIRKVLSKIAKDKGNEDLKEWVKPCERHLYWSETTTSDGNGKVIWAKFKSFLSHIVNKHFGLDEPLFNKCAHGDIPDRKWLDLDQNVYDKLKKALTADSLKKGIMQASPSAQTDCLEGFHSVLNLFAPKLIAYSYIRMYCRHILAALHFNFNLHREDKVKKDGTVPLKVSYPKFKNGEATVRSRKIEQNFDYVEDLFQFFLGLNKQQLQDAALELKEMTPDHMVSMLVDKESREEAIRKREERLRMVTRDVPPTSDPTAGPSSLPAVPDQTERQPRGQTIRARPVCSACKNPMRGQKFVTDCPRNRRT